MHGDFLRLIFLQAHRETEDYFRFTGVSALQPNQDVFRYRRAAFYSGLKSKVGLIAAKAAARRVNMNTDSCLIALHVASRYPCSHPITLQPPPPPLHELVRGVTLAHTPRSSTTS